MKIFERVIKQKIREMVDLNTMQFGFMLGKGTMDAIFIGHQLQERHLDRKVYFEQVSGELVWWAMRKLGVHEWLISAVMIMYRNSTVEDQFGIKVGVHQGPVLSPFCCLLLFLDPFRENEEAVYLNRFPKVFNTGNLTNCLS